MLTIMFLNTWAGSLEEDLFPYIHEQAKSVDIFCLQEVHRCTDLGAPDFLDAGNKGHRQHPLAIKQFDFLKKLLPDHDGYFAPQLDQHLHDLESTEVDVMYGNAMFIRSSLRLIGFNSGMVFRKFNQPNDGMPASRSIQAASILYKENAYVVGHFHGLWKKDGKADCSERSMQSHNACTFISHAVERCCADSGKFPKLIFGGDFNLLSENASFKKLLASSAFANGGGRNLNCEYGVRDTRTPYYPKDKPTREADFVLVSHSVEVQSFCAPDKPVVSDHRPLILTCA